MLRPRLRPTATIARHVLISRAIWRFPSMRPDSSGAPDLSMRLAPWFLPNASSQVFLHMFRIKGRRSNLHSLATSSILNAYAPPNFEGVAQLTERRFANVEPAGRVSSPAPFPPGPSVEAR